MLIISNSRSQEYLLQFVRVLEQGLKLYKTTRLQAKQLL